MTNDVNHIFISLFAIYVSLLVKHLFRYFAPPPFFYIELPFLPFIFTYLALHPACGILVPQSGIKPKTFALEAQNLNHWTAREVLWVAFLLQVSPAIWK